jgi:SOS-response transcriptional repressor LexA
MPTDHRARLATIKRFDQLIAYLRDEMGWPIGRDSFEEVDDLFYEFTADELGIDPNTAAKIQEIKRLRPLSPKQPWGIFFVKFEPKRLPVVALRRILGQVALKKRASANSAERAAWAADDLLFVSNYGEGDERQISIAHFARAQDGHDLPTLKVLGWNNRDTALHLDAVARELAEHLAWPDDDADAEAWRARWRAAFTLGHREVVTTSKELSIRLAELARAIRDRIKTALSIETDKGPLTRLMKSFQTSLVHDLDTEGFADMYAQTIAYGLLSARIADPLRKTADDFAAHMRTNPFLRELMETFLKVGGRRGKAGGPGIDFDELGVSEVVELLDGAKMEAVVRDFGDRNPQEDPVIHFYELFLKEYDAKKRMQRGVFYTPRPVVSYIVRSVDELLRTKFGLADGLADTATWGEMEKRDNGLKIPKGISPDQDFVQILDPATGTGTFLVEVIDLIRKTLVAKWSAQGHGEKKIDALWNEYVPKHLLTRLHGYELLMAPYAIAHLKIGLKLYETGYRFGSDERARVYLTNALESAQNFSGRFEFAIPALAHEARAVNKIKEKSRFTVVIGNPPYSASVSEPAWLMAKLEDWKQGLNETKIDLNREEWKFLRLAQHFRDSSGSAVVGVIINRDFLDGIAKRRMREALGSTFPLRIVVDLNGDVKGNIADENVFEIEQGVTVAIFCSRGDTPSLLYSSRVGTRASKYTDLTEAVPIMDALSAVAVSPPYFRWVPFSKSGSAVAAEDYYAWRVIKDAFQVVSSGIQTKRDALCVAFSREEMWKKVQEFNRLSTSRAREVFELGDDGRDWTVASAKADVASSGPHPRFLSPILYRPLDLRFTYWTGRTKGFMAYPRRDVMQHVVGHPNVGLIFNRQIVGDSVSHFGVARVPICHGTFYLGNKGQDYFAPLWLFDSGLLSESRSPRPNFTDAFLTALRAQLGDEVVLSPEKALNFIYAIIHSPTYRMRYAEFLKIDFPRVPLTGSQELFRSLTLLGGELVALHLLESPTLAPPITEYLGGRAPEVERVSWSNNTVWLDKAQTTGFKGVHEDVWNFQIGGYQVSEKWLKDRKGRTLLNDDIALYQRIVVALSETIRLMKEIDEIIEQHGGWPGAFHRGETKAASAKIIPFRPRTVEPKPEARYVTCVPLVLLRAAAGAFSDPQHVEGDSFEWVAVESRHRLRKGMFVAQVVGRSMEPAIPDGSYCLFRAPIEGTRQGKTVLVQLRDATDPETGQRYTVKRYESEKAAKGDSWRHERITLQPLNPDFERIVLTVKDEGELKVIAELVEVLGGES